MIEQLQFSLRTAETPRLPSAWAYRIYGWLMAQLPADTAARLHEQGEHPLSQSLCFDAAAQTSVWTLNLLDEALAAQVRPLLAGCTTLKLHGAPLQMEPLCRAFKFLQWDLHSKHPRKNICLGLSVPTIPREGRKYKRRNAKCPRQKNFFARSSAG